jgi:hypothetical protein
LDEFPYYDTFEAAEYLTNQRLIRTAPQTLAKYRTIGGGPRFQHFGRFPKYRQDWLDEYAESRISRPKRSTSEAA